MVVIYKNGNSQTHTTQAEHRARNSNFYSNYTNILGNRKKNSFFFGYKILKAQQKKGKQMKKNESRKELRTSSLKQGDECEVFLHF